MSKNPVRISYLEGIRGDLNVVTIGTSNSIAARQFDIKSILPDVYDQLTSNNFYFSNISFGQIGGNGYPTTYAEISKNYNPQTGVLSIAKGNQWTGAINYAITYTVVAIF